MQRSACKKSRAQRTTAFIFFPICPVKMPHIWDAGERGQRDHISYSIHFALMSPLMPSLVLWEVFMFQLQPGPPHESSLTNVLINLSVCTILCSLHMTEVNNCTTIPIHIRVLRIWEGVDIFIIIFSFLQRAFYRPFCVTCYWTRWLERIEAVSAFLSQDKPLLLPKGLPGLEEGNVVA